MSACMNDGKKRILPIVTAHQLAFSLQFDPNLQPPPDGVHQSMLSVAPSDIAVVDVRQGDRLKYGWIPGSLHIPVNTLSKPMFAQLLLDSSSPLAGKRVVVFHCLHSMHRAVWATDTCLTVAAEISKGGENYPLPTILLLKGGFRNWLDMWLFCRPALCEGVPDATKTRVKNARPWKKR